MIDRTDALRDWLPRLTEVLENNAVLIVLDNLESLLTEAAAWRDERWELLVEALLTPGGLSRTVLTSRTRPAALPDSIEVIAVHALPRDEAFLLVRELPNLRRLLDGAKETGVSQEAGRQLVRRVLRLVQGHPKLIELAEAAAAKPAKLAAQLDEADKAQTAGAGELDAFFAQGETRLDPAAFVASLRAWTRGIAGALPEAARIFFHFLCALEEGIGKVGSSQRTGLTCGSVLAAQRRRRHCKRCSTRLSRQRWLTNRPRAKSQTPLRC